MVNCQNNRRKSYNSCYSSSSKKDCNSNSFYTALRFSIWRIFVTINIELTNNAQIISESSKLNVISVIAGVVLSVCTIVRTTDKTAIAKISSTMAASGTRYRQYEIDSFFIINLCWNNNISRAITAGGQYRPNAVLNILRLRVNVIPSRYLSEF